MRSKETRVIDESVNGAVAAKDNAPTHAHALPLSRACCSRRASRATKTRVTTGVCHVARSRRRVAPRTNGTSGGQISTRAAAHSCTLRILAFPRPRPRCNRHSHSMSSSSSAAPFSRLSSLKRSWSGSEQDLQDEEENFVVAPLAKTQKTLVSNGKSDAASDHRNATAGGVASSSQTIVIDDADWSPTPPEQQRAVRANRKFGKRPAA